MKAKGILLAVGLASAGLATAVVLFNEDSKVVELTPQGVDRESPSPSGPVVALAPPADTLETPAPAALEAREQPLAAEERFEVAAPVIHGRVVDADGGLARPWIEIQLKSRSELLASTVSDAAGRFELPFSNASRLAVELVEPEGWQAVRRRQRISGSTPPAEELVFELRLIPGVVFHGRAIDEVSLDPLPYLKLSVGLGFGDGNVETDGEGLFTTKRLYEAGGIEVTPVMSGGGYWMDSRRTIAFDGTSGVHDVPLPVGPTYDVQVTAPQGYVLADLRALLSEEPESCPWTLTNDSSDGESIHAAAPPWVRFLKPVDDATESGLVTLWVCTNDGRWLGSCQVPSRSKRGDGAHEVPLAACGSLVVALRVQGDAPTLGTFVVLRSSTETWGPGGQFESDGRFTFRLIPPGEYLLSVTSNRTKPIERTVRIAAGEPTLVELALESLPHGGNISGFVRSETGHFKATAYLELCPKGQPMPAFFTEVEWKKEGGALVGRFTFKDIPAGSYDLSFPHSSRFFPWRASPSTVSPPTIDVDLLCLDGAGCVNLEIDAVDSRTNKPVSELSVRVSSRSAASAFSCFTGESPPIGLGRYPRQVDFEWEATCDGYLPAAGDLSSFEQAGLKDGEPLLRARLALKPGWGGIVQVYSESGSIESAIVLCDGAEVGRTDSKGQLQVALPARPRRFEVRHPGLVMEYPATGQVPDDAAVLLCYMKPRE